MKVNNKLIQDLSRLAKLKLDASSSKEMKRDLEKMIKFVNKLSEIDTKGIEPLIYLSEEEDSLRADKVSNEVSQEQALKNAPKKDSDYFKVPTILKK
ncbi:Asp-tRNA(Asn)/Glu-tRNA(Gln) amidotransferase subunit GatC [Flavobacteriales bacterium]|nr:Asp-tRNA(Asn)/Glu-tRNA(Gln) amidotransferase subunit GatC [Flavobacteriales bacterium]